MTNPYRQIFYQRQAEWHQHRSADEVEREHRRRQRYLAWYTRGWLPDDRGAAILDIGCGAGQLLYFLRAHGYSNSIGIDVDAGQIELARSLGLTCERTEACDFLERSSRTWSLICLIDVLEHLTHVELSVLMPRIAASLASGGALIISVPNAESPCGMQARYADITHETAFTLASLDQLLFCHGLKVRASRDPYPAPIGAARSIYRGIALGARFIEGLRLRLLGMSAPPIWSPVLWCRAERA